MSTFSKDNMTVDEALDALRDLFDDDAGDAAVANLREKLCRQLRADFHSALDQPLKTKGKR